MSRKPERDTSLETITRTQYLDTAKKTRPVNDCGVPTRIVNGQRVSCGTRRCPTCNSNSPAKQAEYRAWAAKYGIEL